MQNDGAGIRSTKSLEFILNETDNIIQGNTITNNSAFSGGGAAVDATFPLGQNRIHADLGFYSSGVGAAAFYDWSFPIEAGFSFYNRSF